MPYPNYRRNGDTFYNVIDDETITKIAPDENLEYYQFVGKTTETLAEVMEYPECPSDDWMAVCNDLKEVARVGSRPNIPPPPPNEE